MFTLECNYSKKIGLPGDSSRQFSITLRSELSDVGQVQAESARLYNLLQQGVDASIQQVGFLPDNNGDGHSSDGHTNGGGNGRHANQTDGRAVGRGETWTCKPEQGDLILDMSFGGWISRHQERDQVTRLRLVHRVKQSLRH
ncbi:MAG TPA: hypothetical protein VHH73_03820 [Verrucomicrobiae bacterium]|nr:hypothetical protein [Verrucomicrobiae bacterium]